MGKCKCRYAEKRGRGKYQILCVCNAGGKCGYPDVGYLEGIPERKCIPEQRQFQSLCGRGLSDGSEVRYDKSMDLHGRPERDPLREFSDHTGKCHGGHFE